MGCGRRRCGGFQKDCHRQAIFVRIVRIAVAWPDPNTGPSSRLASKEPRRLFDQLSRADVVGLRLLTALRAHRPCAAQFSFEGVGAIHRNYFNFSSRIRKQLPRRATNQGILSARFPPNSGAAVHPPLRLQSRSVSRRKVTQTVQASERMLSAICSPPPASANVPGFQVTAGNWTHAKKAIRRRSGAAEFASRSPADWPAARSRA